eukprot:3407231-Pyramimonas_sp.AAC.1
MRGPRNGTRTGSGAPRPKMAKRAPDSGQASKRPPRGPQQLPKRFPGCPRKPARGCWKRHAH